MLSGSVELDEFDLRLLAAVQADASLPQSELGERVGLSTAAVNRRLKRLRTDGVIQRYGALLSPAALGHALTVVVQIEVENERLDLLDAMKRAFQACPQVQQCYYVAGEWDFILVMAVRDMEQYTALTKKLFFESNNVKRFKTLVALDRVKASLDVPVPPAR